MLTEVRKILLWLRQMGRQRQEYSIGNRTNKREARDAKVQQTVRSV